ncbi:MAG: hypothetical protein R2747_08005 [Pyrinomonadaceae bacterium]
MAGLSASFVLGGAVFLREVFLKKVRQRYLLAEKQLDYNLKNVSLHSKVKRDRNRLSLKKHAAIIQGIQKKSQAARILTHLPDGHWEVFEMCNEYLNLNKKQLETAGIGSPRLPALRRGKEIVEELHRFHLLSWVQIESRLCTEEANKQVELADKIELVQRAQAVIDSALQFYPEEEKLVDSKAALEEFSASIKISHWIEQAEKEKFKQEYQKAISLYRDALFYLARENVRSTEKEVIAERINSEIEIIRQLQEKAPGRKTISRNKKND